MIRTSTQGSYSWLQAIVNAFSAISWSSLSPSSLNATLTSSIVKYPRSGRKVPLISGGGDDFLVHMGYSFCFPYVSVDRPILPPLAVCEYYPHGIYTVSIGKLDQICMVSKDGF